MSCSQTTTCKEADPRSSAAREVGGGSDGSTGGIARLAAALRIPAGSTVVRMKKAYIIKTLMHAVRVFTVSFIDEQMKQMFTFRITVTILYLSHPTVILFIKINISEQ